LHHKENKNISGSTFAATSMAHRFKHEKENGSQCSMQIAA
jgi:hypothetical protein